MSVLYIKKMKNTMEKLSDNAKRNKKISLSYPTSTNFLQDFMYNLYKKYKGGNNICLQNTMKIKGYLR